MPKHGKKYRAAAEKIDAEKSYELSEAVKLAKETSTTTFDATVELHVRTSANPKYADQMIRASITLPHGTGKSKRIGVVCEVGEEAAAKKAGAEVVGAQIIADVEQGKIDFDILVATPSMMKELAKVAKVLGPKGLMPSPKAGTVTPDVAKAVEELVKGKMEFKLDKSGIIHSIIGKASFTEKQLQENADALLEAINGNKPAGVKGKLIQTVSMTTSMGPGIFVAA